VRYGSIWGFQGFTGGEGTRYRRKDTSYDMNQGEFTEKPAEALAGMGEGIFSAACNLDYYEEFDEDTGGYAGFPEKVITACSAITEGNDWTPRWQEVELGIWMAGTATSPTRRVGNRDYGKWMNFSHAIRFDAGNRYGPVVSTTWVKVAATYTGGSNILNAVDFPPPAAGHSLVFGGYRMTYP